VFILRDKMYFNPFLFHEPLSGWNWLVVWSSSSWMKRLPTTLVKSQWLSNLLSNQTWAAVM